MGRIRGSLGGLSSEVFRRRYGAYDTPPHIVDLMIELTGIEDFSGLKVLEPACGLAPFSHTISKVKGWDGIVGVEVNPNIARAARELYPEFDVIVGDYLLLDLHGEFDLVIGNPPYGIIGSESHYAISIFKQYKDVYRRTFETWFGKYNIYGLFVEKSIRDLRDGGILSLIIPATWMILDEFRKLRRFLASSGKVEVYYLGRGIFNGLGVSVVILIVRKGGIGLELYEIKNGKPMLNHRKEIYGGEVVTFETELTRELEGRARKRLGDIFDIRISPRSPEIRSTGFISRKKIRGYVPVLNGKNLDRDRIDYETSYSGYYIRVEDIGKLRPFFLKDRIVVGHTKGGKLVSAIDNKHYAWMGDVYHLIPKYAREFTLDEINRVLNSELMNRYMREKYRDITPHTTKTQLKALPLIPYSEIMIIEERLQLKTHD